MGDAAACGRGGGRMGEGRMSSGAGKRYLGRALSRVGAGRGVRRAARRASGNLEGGARSMAETAIDAAAQAGDGTLGRATSRRALSGDFLNRVAMMSRPPRWARARLGGFAGRCAPPTSLRTGATTRRRAPGEACARARRAPAEAPPIARPAPATSRPGRRRVRVFLWPAGRPGGARR